MVDKLDLRIPRHTPFSPAFNRLYPELQALEKGPFCTSKYYEYVGDLRPYGHNVRLNLYCQNGKTGNHKLELIDVGDLGRDGIIREIIQVFDVDPSALEVMRVDFAVDVPRLPVQWFRETVQVQHMRFRSAVTGERFYCEMGKGELQTLYFGKRPNLIRIYDKKAEYRKQFKKMVRDLGPEFDSTFEAMFPNAAKHSILTRVERQLGGRIPVEVSTLGQIFESGYEYQPFAKLKIIDHAEPLERDENVSFETYCTGRFLRDLAECDGMQAVKEFIAKQSKGNTSWAWKKYSSFLPSATAKTGITGKTLQAHFSESMRRQLMP
jgi:hypothetical protein